MTESDAAKFELLANRIHPGSRLLRAWGLKGGISAQATALEIERLDGLTQKVVVRRHSFGDLTRSSRVAEDEFRLLQLLQGVGLPTPEPYYLDKSGELFSTPCVVIEYIEGETDYTPSDLPNLLTQMAEHLARIHTVTPASVDLSFLPSQQEIYGNVFRERPATVDDSLDEGLIRAVLETTWPLPGRNADVLLHGDFWPGNILWKDGRVVGIIDWEDARVGDPLEDLAISRLDVLWAFGMEAMHSFTDHYRSITAIDFANLPYWDLCAALRPAFQISAWATANDASAQAMREGHKLFVAQALEKLAL